MAVDIWGILSRMSGGGRGSAVPRIAALAVICAMHGTVAFGQAGASSDRAVLEELYDATGGAGWRDDTNWKTAVPLGEWHGVTTNSGGRVTRVDLDGNGLSGSIPTALGRLEKLESLVLRRNALAGPIPGALGSLANLEVLHLSDNDLTGPIPGTLENLVELEDSTSPQTR